MSSWAARKIQDWASKVVMKSLLSGLNQTSAIYGYMGAPNTLAGESVNQDNAESISTFFTCLRIKAETIASLSTTVQKVEDDTSKRDRNHPVDRLVSLKASNILNAYDFWFSMQYFEDLWGNSYAYIQRNSGRPTELKLWYPWEVQVRRDNEDQSIWYVHKGVAYPARDVLHFKQNSGNGLMGRSVISIGREKLGLAKKQESYASKVYGERPPAVFEDGASLTNAQAIEIAKGFKDHVQKGLTPMVWGGLKYKPIMMPPGDAQLFESQQTSKGDIAGMFRMPPSKLQSYSRKDGATYANVEQQEISFVRDVVIPATKSKMIECNIKLFNNSEQSNYEVQFDLSELLKGDIKTEKALIESMLTRGVFTINMALKRLGQNPVPEGDRRFIQAGFIPLDRADDFIDNGKNGMDKDLKKLLKEYEVN